MIKNCYKTTELAKALIAFQIYYNCVIKFCIGHLGVPSAANYLTDAITIILVFLMLRSSKACVKKSGQLFCTVLFAAVVGISFIVNGYSGTLLLWGARNVFRFYFFFFACVYFLEIKDFDDIAAKLKVLFWINTALIMYQRWVLNYIGDGCSGLYSLGNMSGGNGSVNVLMCVVVCYMLAEYASNRTKLGTLLLYLIASIAIAAAIELKFFFIELIIFVALYIAVQQNSTKAFGLVVAFIVVLLYGMDMLQRIYPAFEGIFAIDSLIEDSMQYGVSEKVGRLSGMGIILDRYLTTPFQKLFGIGLGNADYSSSFSFLTSAFYRQHTELAYYYFISAWMILETGILGTVSYLALIVFAIGKSWRLRKAREYHTYAALMMGFMILLQFFYNQMLRVETSGYLLQLALALIFIVEKENCGVERESSYGKN